MAKAKAVTIDSQDMYPRATARLLAYLCLSQAERTEPKRLWNLLDKVKFLTDLGLPEADAAYAAGSNPESVRVQKAKRKPKKDKG